MKYNLDNPQEIKKAYAYLSKLSENSKEVEIKAIRKKRTISQNSYLHVCVSIIAIELGYNLEECKTMLKRKCNFMIYEKNGQKFLRRTRDMQTDELTKFIEWIRNFGGVNGINIPTSEEYLLNRINIDNEIERNKEFL